VPQPPVNVAVPVAEPPVNNVQPPGQGNNLHGKTQAHTYCLAFVLTAS
jgi:hypothetical protein